MLFSYVVGFSFQGLYFIILAKGLGPSQYGLFAAVFAVSTMLGVLVGLGSGNVMVMHTSRLISSFSGQYGTALIYIAVSALPFGFVGILLALSGSSVMLKVAVPLLLSELVFNRCLDLGYQVCQSHDFLKGTALFNIAAGVLRFTAAAAFFAAGFSGVVNWSYVYLVANALLAISITAFCMVRFGTPTLDRVSLRTTWRVGIFFSLGMASRTVYVDSDKYLLGVYNPNAAVNGVYAVGSRVINFMFIPIQAAVYTRNTDFFRAGESGYVAVWGIVRRLLLPTLAYGVICFICILFGAHLLVPLLGESYAELELVLPWFAPLILLQGVHYIFGDALMGLGRQSTRGIVQFCVAVLSAALGAVLIPFMGWQGAVLTVLGSACVLAVTMSAIFFIGLLRENRETAAILGGVSSRVGT
ncbi:hypothetical protein KXR83_14110 [Williamsia muralis]|uniref:hypothetical protein n=1 Tax=Williamsia marianensis TaxID=85044 RepID=UPI003F149597